MWWNSILERFKVYKAGGQGKWKAFCPAHPDRRPSLSIWLGRTGCLLIGCWAGCEKKDILKEVGLTMSDLFPPNADGPYTQRAERPLHLGTETAWYNYTAETGELLYQAVRYEPKGFRYRRPGPGGEKGLRWIWNLEGVRRVLFQLPAILNRGDEPVVVCEGEKDAMEVTKLGYVGTTNCGGCGMGWGDDYSRVLVGRRCVVIPDNDEGGYKRGDQIVGSLLRHGAGSVRLCVLDCLGIHGDISDFLDLFEGIEKKRQAFREFVGLHPRLGALPLVG